MIMVDVAPAVVDHPGAGGAAVAQLLHPDQHMQQVSRAGKMEVEQFAPGKGAGRHCDGVGEDKPGHPLSKAMSGEGALNIHDCHVGGFRLR